MNTEQERAEFENWARWYALPVTRLVNDDRYESLETEAAHKAWQAGRAAQEDSEDKWRDLALQFDGHRMQALAWLKQILAESPADAWPFARTFLKSPPMSGEAVLAERIEELAAHQSQDADDPLQPAANWLNEAIIDLTATDIQRRLFVGYNRAQRLLNHARSVERDGK